MTARARFTQQDVKRALSGALAAGVSVANVKIHPNGHIELLLGNPKPQHDNDEWDDLK